MNIQKLILAVVFVLSGCSENELDKQLEQLVRYHQISSDPIADKAQQVRDINSPQAQLGKLLFFSKTLSGNGDVACVSCHHPLLGGDDDLSLSVGVDAIEADILGKARLNLSGAILVPRNAPTTFNSSLWQKRLFHDGRVERLNDFTQLPAKISSPDERYGDQDYRSTSLVQSQAGFPVTSEHEMRALYKDSSSNDSLRQALVNNLVISVEQKKKKNKNSETWQELFLNIHPEDKGKPLAELMSFARIRHLLAEYEMSQVFVKTPWQQYLQGDSSALSNSEKRGAVLFYTDVERGGAGCVACHSGSFFTDEEFHVAGFPHIGQGIDIRDNDTGRFLRTGIYDDRYAFRTPSLINVELTAPYGHNGAFANLEQVIQYHIDPERAAKVFDYSLSHLEQKGINNKHSKDFTAKAIKQMVRAQKQGINKLKRTDLDSSQITDLISFMQALTDPCIQDADCLAPWLPSLLDPKPDQSLIFFAPE